MKVYDKLEEYLIALCIVAMTGINFGNVLSRYLLKASWSFTEELLIILFIWSIMLATALAYKRSEHLGLPLIIDKLSPVLQKICIVFSGLMSSALLIYLSVSGYYMVKNQIQYDQVTPVLNLPEWVAGASVPIGALFILFRVIQSTITQVMKVREED